MILAIPVVIGMIFLGCGLGAHGFTEIHAAQLGIKTDAQRQDNKRDFWEKQGVSSIQRDLVHSTELHVR